VWRALPDRRLAELVGALVIGQAVNAPDEVAGVALVLAGRVLELVGQGLTPPAAYQAALGELGLTRRPA
jgi:hypothetical protein